MNEREDGGAAFPQISELGDIAATSGGMTLRDWFAGQALVEYANLVDVREIRTSKFVAQICYTMADAMLEARK